MSNHDLKISPLSLSHELNERVQYIEKFYQKPSLLSEMAKNAVFQASVPQALSGIFQVVHQVQRLFIIAKLGLQENPSILDAMESKYFPLWDQYVALDATEKQKQSFAKLMYEGDPEMSVPIALYVSDYSRGVAEIVLEKIIENQDEVDIWVYDLPFHRRVLNCVEIEKIEDYADLLTRPDTYAARQIVFSSNDPSVSFVDDVPEHVRAKRLRKRTAENYNKYNKHKFYTLTLMPTHQDAALDGFPHDQYVEQFFKACSVDYQEINKAHQILIAKLNAASIVRVTNNDGTDLTLDIEKATFANSLVAKNIPGSEVFSAPKVNSANGRIVANGRFIYTSADELIENITLDFKDGVVTSYAAEKGQKYLTQIIETDEGSRRIGEFALGTNPAWQTHSVNSLLVEKVGGSFHVALGAAYEYTEYMGVPVNLDNGNRSNIHWDITTMLLNKDGMVTLDGELLIKNGRYVDPALSYLNAPLPV